MYELQYHVFKNYLIKSLLVGKCLQVLKRKVKFSVKLTCNKQAYQVFKQK
jgi:hypothetical protein